MSVNDAIKTIKIVRKYFKETPKKKWFTKGNKFIEKDGVELSSSILGEPSKITDDASMLFSLGFMDCLKYSGNNYFEHRHRYTKEQIQNLDELDDDAILSEFCMWCSSERWMNKGYEDILRNKDVFKMLNRLESILEKQNNDENILKKSLSQMTGISGEFLVASKLYKMGLIATITLGCAKAIDIIAFNERNNQTYNVQVKTLRKKNCFLIDKNKINADHIYVFVLLGYLSIENDISKDDTEKFYIVQGKEILQHQEHFFGSSYAKSLSSSMPAINYGPLKDYQNNWNLFEQKIVG